MHIDDTPRPFHRVQEEARAGWYAHAARGAGMSNPDVLVLAPDATALLVVEVKGGSKRCESAAWAMELHGNLLSHRMVPASPYFMLVLPAQVFVWHTATETSSLPDEIMPTSQLLGSYFPEAFRSEESPPLSKESLELAVYGWLDDLIADPARGESTEPSWLHDSGLLNRLKAGATVSNPGP